MAQQPYTLRLLWSRNLTPTVKHLAFQREDGQSPLFQAGQFITLHIPTPAGKVAHRSYSLANPPNADGILEMAAAFIEGGLASTLLFNLKEGETLSVTGPYGLFILKDEQPKRYVLVATGTGVTPYRSMLPQLLERLEKRPELSVELILGVRKKDDLLFGDEFLRLVQNQDRFKFHACYSRESEEQIQATHESLGRVQDKFENLNLDPANDIVYLCGNPGMIDDAFKLLCEQYGFDKKAVRREKYTFSH